MSKQINLECIKFGFLVQGRRVWQRSCTYCGVWPIECREVSKITIAGFHKSDIWVLRRGGHDRLRAVRESAQCRLAPE
jgi:hypothetical protein